MPAESVNALYPRLIAEHPRSVAGYVSQASFLDIGTPRDCLDTSLALAESEGARFIGARARIGDSAVLVRSMVWDDVTVGARAHLHECIVADGARIPDGARYERCAIVAGRGVGRRSTGERIDGELLVRVVPEVLPNGQSDHEQPGSRRRRSTRAHRRVSRTERSGAALAARRAAHGRRLRPALLPRPPARRAVDRAVALCRRRSISTRCRSSTSRGCSSRCRCPIPTVLGHAGDLGVLALEDLGDVTLQAHLGAVSPAEHAARYRQAVALIATLQRRGAELESPAYLPYGIAFDVEKLTWEMDFFTKHFIEAYRGVVIARGRARRAPRRRSAS